MTGKYNTYSHYKKQYTDPTKKKQTKVRGKMGEYGPYILISTQCGSVAEESPKQKY